MRQVWRGRALSEVEGAPARHKTLAVLCASVSPRWNLSFGNGKGHAAFATWPLFMPAMTYSPTRVWRGRPRPRKASR
jgi:hypothetical protein